MEKLSAEYFQWMENDSDFRVRDWFLMSSPLPTVAICVSLLSTAKLLNIWMRRKGKVISIRWPIWCFDFFHLTISSAFLITAVSLKLLENFNFRCQPIDPSSNSDATVKLAWLYFIYNFTFFSEIFIFLLGKRHDRITNYFLYHHIALPISIYFVVKFTPTGHSLIFAIVNCTVHVLTFGYLSIIGAFPKLKVYFWWWKRFFHLLLILRIVTIVLHALQLFVRNDCNYPLVYPIIVLINTPFFVILTCLDHLLADRKRRREYFVNTHKLNGPLELHCPNHTSTQS